VADCDYVSTEAGQGHTHDVPEASADRPVSPFTFVTEGVEAAIAKAKQIAGGKDVGGGAPSIAQQCRDLGLLDEIGLDLVPVVLRGGCSIVRASPDKASPARGCQRELGSGRPTSRTASSRRTLTLSKGWNPEVWLQ